MENGNITDFDKYAFYFFIVSTSAKRFGCWIS